MNGAKTYQDRGWAWLVVFGGFITHFLTCGMEKGYSVLYVELIREYKTSAAFASSLGGFSASMRLVLAPVSVELCHKFGERMVVICGGLFCFFGLVLCSFAHKLFVLVIGYGFIFGFGLTLTFTPALVMCTTYFSKYRATALGLSTMGCGLGSVVLPFLMVFLIERYSYYGAIMILGSICLHFCVSGVLFRPVPKIRPSEFSQTSPHVNVLANPGSRCGRLFCLMKRKLLCNELKRNPWAALFLSSFIFNMMGSGPVVTLLVHYAEQHGHKTKASVLLLAVEGITQVVMRLLTGILFDLPFIKPYRQILWCGDLCASSIVVILLAFSTSLPSLAALMFFRGIFMAVYISQQTLMAADMCENMGSGVKQAIGFTQCSKGIGILLGSWFAGIIKDICDDYRPAFIFLGAMQFVGSIMALVAVLGSNHFRCLPSCRYRRRGDNVLLSG